MNKRQRYVLEHPLENPFASASTAAQYREIIEINGLKFSTLLTVESQGNESQWHASIALIGYDGKPAPMIGVIGKDDGEAAFDYLHRMLKDVGTGQIRALPPGEVFHMFKDLAPLEKTVKKKKSAVRN